MAWDIGADEYVGTTDRAAIVTAVEFEAPPPVPSDPTTVAVTGVTTTTISISLVDPNDPDAGGVASVDVKGHMEVSGRIYRIVEVGKDDTGFWPIRGQYQERMTRSGNGAEY